MLLRRARLKKRIEAGMGVLMIGSAAVPSSVGPFAGLLRFGHVRRGRNGRYSPDIPFWY